MYREGYETKVSPTTVVDRELPAFLRGYKGFGSTGTSSSLLHQSPDGLSFVSGLERSPGTCPVPSEEDKKIQELVGTVGNLSCGLSTTGTVTQYCECIDSKEMSKESKTRSHIKKLASDLYASALASKLNNALVSYFKNAELVGYGQATSDITDQAITANMKEINGKREGKVKYPSCSPKNLEKMLDVLNATKLSNKKGCLEGAVGEKTVKVLKNKIREKSLDYAKLSEVDVSISDSVFNIASKVDKTLSGSFEAGMVAQDNSITNAYRRPGSVENLAKHRPEFNAKQKADFLRLYDIAKKATQFKYLTPEEYEFIAGIYKKNPIYRKISPVRAFNSTKFTSQFFYDPKSINSNSFETQNLLKKFAIGAINSSYPKGMIFIDVSEEDLYIQNQMVMAEKAKEANSDCVKQFEEVEKFCSGNQWKYIKGSNPEELSSVINDIYISDESSIDEAVTAHVDAGHVFCSLYSCKNKRNAKEERCIDNSKTDGTFDVYDVSSTEYDISRKIENGDFGVSTDSSIATSGFSEGPISEPDMESVTDIVDSSSEEYHAVTGFEQAAASSFDSSTPSQIKRGEDFASKVANYSLPSSSTSTAIEDENAVARDLAQVEAANSVQNSAEKELQKVQAELAKAKQESENAKKELEELKSREALAEQQRVNEENERRLQSTISSLEDKISKLEQREASISTQSKNKKVSFSNPMNSSSNNLANYSSELVENNGNDTGSSPSVGTVSRSSNFSNAAISGGKDSQAAKTVLRRLEESRSQGVSGAGGGLSILSAQSLDDPSLQSKVKEAYKNGVQTIYVNVAGSVYRISPMLDSKGNIVEEDGALKFVTEIATAPMIEEDEVAANLKDLKRLPASITDEPVINPDDPAYRKAQLDALLNAADGDK